MLFVPKNSIIEAIQWNGNNLTEILGFTGLELKDIMIDGDIITLFADKVQTAVEKGDYIRKMGKLFVSVDSTNMGLYYEEIEKKHSEFDELEESMRRVGEVVQRNQNKKKIKTKEIINSINSVIYKLEHEERPGNKTVIERLEEAINRLNILNQQKPKETPEENLKKAHQYLSRYITQLQNEKTCKGQIKIENKQTQQKEPECQHKLCKDCKYEKIDLDDHPCNECTYEGKERWEEKFQMMPYVGIVAPVVESQDFNKSETDTLKTDKITNIEKEAICMSLYSMFDQVGHNLRNMANCFHDQDMGEK